MTKELRKGCMSFLVWAGCHHIICSFWRALEITAYGKVLCQRCGRRRYGKTYRLEKKEVAEG